MNIRDYINIILEASASNMSRPDAIAIFARYGVPNAGQLSIPDLVVARKKLIMKHHPDRGGDPSAAAYINSAFDTLKDGEGIGARRQQQKRPPEPPKRPVMKYRMGQWVVILDDGVPGKIVNINIHNTFGNGYFINYDVQTVDGFTDRYAETMLRAATQDDLDRMAAFPKPKFKVGDYLLCTDDDQVCIVRPGGVGYDREKKGYCYEVEFISDGKWDILDEIYLRRATAEEIAAAKPEKADFEVLMFARYVDPKINANKVYGVVVRDDKIYTFWGGYGKSLAVNQQDDPDIAYLLFNSKLRKGYKAQIGTPEPWLSNALKARFATLNESANMSQPDAVRVFARYGVPDAGRMALSDLSNTRRQLLRQYHPDIGGDDEASALINSAFDTLKDGGGQVAAPVRQQQSQTRPKYMLNQWVVKRGTFVMGQISRIYPGNPVSYDVTNPQSRSTVHYDESEIRGMQER